MADIFMIAQSPFTSGERVEAIAVWLPDMVIQFNQSYFVKFIQTCVDYFPMISSFMSHLLFLRS